jgi:hypothetical protein
MTFHVEPAAFPHWRRVDGFGLLTGRRVVHVSDRLQRVTAEARLRRCDGRPDIRALLHFGASLRSNQREARRSNEASGRDERTALEDTQPPHVLFGEIPRRLHCASTNARPSRPSTRAPSREGARPASASDLPRNFIGHPNQGGIEPHSTAVEPETGRPPPPGTRGFIGSRAAVRLEPL